MSDRLIKLQEVIELTSKCRSKILLEEKQGTFPKSVKIAHARSVRWSYNEIQHWIKQQLDSRHVEANIPVIENVPGPASTDFKPLPCAAFLEDVAPQGIEGSRWPAGGNKGGWVTGDAAVQSIGREAAKDATK